MKVKITTRNDIPFLTHQMGQKQSVSHSQSLAKRQRNRNATRGCWKCHGMGAVGWCLAGLNLCKSATSPQIPTLRLAHWEDGLYSKRLLLELTAAAGRGEQPSQGSWPRPFHGLPGLREALRQWHMPSICESVYPSLRRVCTYMFRMHCLNTSRLLPEGTDLCLCKGLSGQKWLRGRMNCRFSTEEEGKGGRPAVLLFPSYSIAFDDKETRADSSFGSAMCKLKSFPLADPISCSIGNK